MALPARAGAPRPATGRGRQLLRPRAGSRRALVMRLTGPVPPAPPGKLRRRRAAGCVTLRPPLVVLASAAWLRFCCDGIACGCDAPTSIPTEQSRRILEFENVPRAENFLFFESSHEGTCALEVPSENGKACMLRCATRCNEFTQSALPTGRMR